jgi:PEP-CTERM motif
MGRFNRFLFATMAVTLLLLCGAPAFADVIVYNQPPTLDGNLYASQNDPTLGNFAALYDNFTIVPTIPYYLTDVHWYGGYFNPQQHGVITGWTISIYSDPLGPIGTLPIWTQHFANTAFESFYGVFNGTTYYAYHEDDIMNGLKLMPGTMYWLSLVPDSTFPPQWGWRTGLLGDGVSYQDFFGVRTQLGVDFGYDISGVPAPEPGSLILVGTGILGLAGALRRKLF